MQKNPISPPHLENELFSRNAENLHFRVDQIIGSKQESLKYHQRHFTMKGNENKQIQEIVKNMRSLRVTATSTPNKAKRMFRETPSNTQEHSTYLTSELQG